MATKEIIPSRELLKSFDLRDERLMLSLGPLSSHKYCTYSCRFCYLQSNDFPSYVSLPVSEIVKWVQERSQPFNIIYISGDTDSFAPPRTEKGLELLESLTEFGVDILFTTRTLFQDNHFASLARTQKLLEEKNKMLVGCVSISQLYHPELEPKPIPSPKERMEQLKRFKTLGIVSVLALRPFLPHIPLKEYVEIVDSTKEFVDIVLGSDWFVDQGGILESQVLPEKEIDNSNIGYEKLDFYNSKATWKVYKNPEVAEGVEAFCKSQKLPFFMRSMPAIRWLRDKKFCSMALTSPKRLY